MVWWRGKGMDIGDLLTSNIGWSVFTNTIGKRELYKLNYYQSGVNFGIRTVGAKVINGMVDANIQHSGLTIRYTTDDNGPTSNSMIYTSAISQKGTINLRAFDYKRREEKEEHYRLLMIDDTFINCR